MGISIWQLVIILAVVLVLFGAKRLRNLGGDLGASVKGFREAMKDGEKDETPAAEEAKAERSIQNNGEQTIDGEVVKDKGKV